VKRPSYEEAAVNKGATPEANAEEVVIELEAGDASEVPTAFLALTVNV
jgi:hypothetical protein